MLTDHRAVRIAGSVCHNIRSGLHWPLICLFWPQKPRNLFKMLKQFAGFFYLNLKDLSEQKVPGLMEPEELNSGTKRGALSPFCAFLFAFPPHQKNREDQVNYSNGGLKNGTWKYYLFLFCYLQLSKM